MTSSSIVGRLTLKLPRIHHCSRLTPVTSPVFLRLRPSTDTEFTKNSSLEPTDTSHILVISLEADTDTEVVIVNNVTSHPTDTSHLIFYDPQTQSVDIINGTVEVIDGLVVENELFTADKWSTMSEKKRKFSTAGGMSTFSTKTTGDGQSFDSVMAFEYVSDSESDLDQIPQLPVSRFMQHFFQSV